MIYFPQNNQYITAIESSIKDLSDYQIAISILFPVTYCLYDRILTINLLTQKIFLNYRRINRRANISEFLVVLSDKVNSGSLCTLLVKHNSHLHDETVQRRIVMILELVSALEIDANVFQPYSLKETDFNRYHLKNIKGSFSINILKANQQLQLRDCAEF